MNATASQPRRPVESISIQPRLAPFGAPLTDPKLSAFAFALLLACLAPSVHAGINLSVSRSISLPSVAVAPDPQTVFSGDQTLSLNNSNVSNGWILNASVENGVLLGSSSGETIAATILFKSVIWRKGGNGTVAGIAISQDGSRVEADPGFGLGSFDIVFEVRYDVPAFPRSDTYQGVSTFVIQ